MVVASSASGGSGPRVVWSSGAPWSAQSGAVSSGVSRGLPSVPEQWIPGPVCELAPPLPASPPLPRPPLPVEAEPNRSLSALEVASQTLTDDFPLPEVTGEAEESGVRVSRRSRRRRRHEDEVGDGVEAVPGAAVAGVDQQEAETAGGMGEISEGSFSPAVTSSSFLSSSSSSSSSSSGSSSDSSASPRRPRKFVKRVARAVEKRLGAGRSRKAVAADPPLYDDMVRCANTAITRGLRKSVKKRIRKGKFVDVFTLTDEAKKELEKAKKAGESAVEALKDFQHWHRGFLVFAACYLETRPQEANNVLKYQFLINEFFLASKTPLWREYDEKFRRKQCGNLVMPLGFKDVEVWLEVVGRGGVASSRGAEGAPKRPFLAGKGVSGGSTKGKCFAFNESKCDRGGRCRFRHACRVCNGSHPAKDCRAQGGRPSSSHGEAGGGATKGPLAN